MFSFLVTVSSCSILETETFFDCCYAFEFEEWVRSVCVETITRFQRTYTSGRKSQSKQCILSSESFFSLLWLERVSLTCTIWHLSRHSISKAPLENENTDSIVRKKRNDSWRTIDMTIWRIRCIETREGKKVYMYEDRGKSVCDSADRLVGIRFPAEGFHPLNSRNPDVTHVWWYSPQWLPLSCLVICIPIFFYFFRIARRSWTTGNSKRVTSPWRCFLSRCHSWLHFNPPSRFWDIRLRCFWGEHSFGWWSLLGS